MVFKTGSLNHSDTLPNQYFQVLSARSEQNKPRNWHPIGTLAVQRRVDRRGRLAVVLLEQVGIDAQGNIRLRVPEALGNRDDNGNRHSGPAGLVHANGRNVASTKKPPKGGF
jgi:hypothetical protein